MKREKIIQHIIEKGRAQMVKLSSEYLQIKNDLPIANNLLQYKSLLERYNKIADSLFTAKEKLNEEIGKVKEIIFLYDAVTSKQIDFLDSLNLPQGFIVALNSLVESMEKVDADFSNKCLAYVFKNPTPIRDIQFSEVTHGLIKHLRENAPALENGTSE